MHLGRYLAFWAQRRGDALFMACDGERLSWRELDRVSGALAAHLSAQGVKPGDRLGCLLGNSIPWTVAFATSLRLGTIFVPLNPLFGRFELEQIAADAECAAILSTPSLIAKLGITDADPSADTVRLYRRGAVASARDYSEVVATRATYADAPRSDDDVMIICYTSGTTGVPKGVMLTHRAVDAAIQGLMLNFGLRGGDERLLILAPLGFTGGVISCLAVQVVCGGSGWLEKSVDPLRALKLLREERITVFGGVPALWERIARAPGFADADLASLRAAYTGGAPVPRPLLDLFRAKGVTIRQQYGFSEACGGVSSQDEAGATANPESCGRALPGVELEVRDSDGRPVSAGEVGEIHARGAQLMAGYWRKPEATAEAFAGDGWYRTGDLARLDADGGIVIVDRKKNMLISGGVNIYPAEVERALGQIPGVLEAVVFGIPSAQWGDEVVAIAHGPGLDAATILDRLREMIGAYKTPKLLRLSPNPLPKTASNKIARTGLPELFENLA